MPEFAHVGDFCPNKDCRDYGKPQVGQPKKNIKKNGKTKKGKRKRSGGRSETRFFGTCHTECT